MPAILAEPDVYAAAVEALRTRGYQVWHRKWQSWAAERDGRDFEAENPIALLGLVVAYDDHLGGPAIGHGGQAARAMATPRLAALHRDADGVILEAPRPFVPVAPGGYREPIQGYVELVAYPASGPRAVDPRSAELRAFLGELDAPAQGSS